MKQSLKKQRGNTPKYKQSLYGNAVPKIHIFILFLLCFLPFLPFVYGYDSTNPNDYFFYDTMEDTDPLGIYESYRNISNSIFNYSTAEAYQGTQSLEHNKFDATPRYGIRTENLTTQETMSPYCMDLWHLAAFTWNGYYCIGFDDDDSWQADVVCPVDIAGNIAVANTSAYVRESFSNTNYTPVATDHRAWNYLKICTGDGWASSGTTHIDVWHNSTYVANITLINRINLNRTTFVNIDAGGDDSFYIDNVRIWNRTQHGDDPPQLFFFEFNTSIESINGNVFTNGNSYEVAENNTIFFNYSGNNGLPLVNVSFNISNSTTVIFSTANHSINITNAELQPYQLYTLDLFIQDNESNFASTTNTFSFNDTINPTITWIDPSIGNTSTHGINESFTAQATVSDVNLFAYEMLVFDDLLALRYNFTVIDLNVSTVIAQGSVTPDRLGVWTVQTTVADDHTVKRIPTYMYNEYDEGFFFPDKNVDIKFIGYPIESKRLNKKQDRYEFEYTPRLGTERNNPYVYITSEVSCPDIIYRKNSPYTGHFVCPQSNTWVDFESDNIYDATVKKKTAGYEVRLKMATRDTYMFHSIGGINEISENATFNVTLNATAPSGNETTPNVENVYQCVNTTSDTFMLFLFLAILIVIFFGSMLLRIPVVALLSIFGFIVYGIIILSCENTIGVFMIISGCLMAFWFMVNVGRLFK